MRLVLKVSSSNEHWNGGCEFALVELAPELSELALASIAVLNAQKSADPHIDETCYWAYFVKCYFDPWANVASAEKEVEAASLALAAMLVPKMTHRLDLVQRHCAERVIEVAISVGRAARIPVSSQIRHVDREPLGESRRHFVPGSVALGKSMQKKHRWSVAFVKNRDGRAAGANLSLHKAGKKLRRDILRRLRWQFGQRFAFHSDSLHPLESCRETANRCPSPD